MYHRETGLGKGGRRLIDPVARDHRDELDMGSERVGPVDQHVTMGTLAARPR